MEKGKPPWGPLNPAPPHIAIKLDVEAADAFAVKKGWGPRISDVVLGDVLVLTYEGGGQLTVAMPPGSRLTK